MRGSAANAAGPRQKTIIREKTLYVPYEKLEDIFEKEGRLHALIEWFFIDPRP